MAIRKKPSSNQIDSTAPSKEDKFIEGAEKKEEKKQEEKKPEPKTTPVLIRFDIELLRLVDEAAKLDRRSRSAWIQYTLSKLLEPPAAPVEQAKP